MLEFIQTMLSITLLTFLVGIPVIVIWVIFSWILKKIMPSKEWFKENVDENRKLMLIRELIGYSVVVLIIAFYLLAALDAMFGVL